MLTGPRGPIKVPDAHVHPALAPRGDGILYLGHSPMTAIAVILVALMWVALAVAVIRLAAAPATLDRSLSGR